MWVFIINIYLSNFFAFNSILSFSDIWWCIFISSLIISSIQYLEGYCGVIMFNIAIGNLIFVLSFRFTLFFIFFIIVLMCARLLIRGFITFRVVGAITEINRWIILLIFSIETNFWLPEECSRLSWKLPMFWLHEPKKIRQTMIIFTFMVNTLS